MKTLLHVIASPRGGKSRTLKIACAFLDRFHELHPDWLTDEINLFQETLPALTARRVDGKYLLLGGKDLYGDLREAWDEIKTGYCTKRALRHPRFTRMRNGWKTRGIP